MEIAKNNEKIEYVIYARKSTEDDKRQVQSIDDQVRIVKELANNQNLNIKEIYTESKSAKEPGRPVFEKMMQEVEDGKYNGILCYHLNRLSRNPIDSGRISWLLQKGKIKSIVTPYKRYNPEDNVLLFNIESGEANQFVRDLSHLVKRGLKSKVEKGWRPGLPPLGYVNDLINKTIVKDPERFILIKKIWELMLEGKYTPPKILEIVNKTWGFTTRKYRKIGGNSLSRSGIYAILTNVFYTGYFNSKGELKKGNHEPMITLEQFDKVQFLLGREGKPRPKKYVFPFTGMIRCEECGCLFTAETKRKLIKSSGEVKEYTFYHCTKKKPNYKCSNTKHVRDTKLEEQIEIEINNLRILPEFRKWAIEAVHSDIENEKNNIGKMAESVNKALKDTETQIDRLIEMKYKDQLTDDEYNEKKTNLVNRKTRLREELRSLELQADESLELSEKAFDFITYAHTWFNEGTIEDKKSILMTLGSNLLVKDGILKIQPAEWLNPIITDYKTYESEYLTLEPEEKLAATGTEGRLSSIRTRWLGR